MPIFQKNLDWVRRFFFNTSVGDLPMPATTLDVSHDWPLELLLRQHDYVTIAGVVDTIIIRPSEGRHSMVIFLKVAGSAAAIPATDAVDLVYERVGGFAPLLITSLRGLARQHLSLIGGQAVEAVASGGWIAGIPPVYIPAGFQLRLSHFSVAGGVAIDCRSQVWELPFSYPLRLP